MMVAIVRETNLDYAEETINKEIERLECDGYRIVDVKYMNGHNNGYSYFHYIMIIYE